MDEWNNKPAFPDPSPRIVEYTEAKDSLFREASSNWRPEIQT